MQSDVRAATYFYEKFDLVEEPHPADVLEKLLELVEEGGALGHLLGALRAQEFGDPEARPGAPRRLESHQHHHHDRILHDDTRTRQTR